MFVQTCSLGCSSGQGGVQVSCSVVEAFVNQEIAITFSDPVDPASVDSGTFQLIDANTGQTPLGTRFVDPGNPNKIIFRPTVAFDTQGNASFGFAPNTTYRITVPGTAQNDLGPFVMSTGGRPNRSRLLCDIRTSQGVVDPVPGRPRVSVTVDLAIVTTPTNPNDIIPNQPAAGAVNVWRNSTIRFMFDDVMNPVTLANPVTMQPTFASVKVDADGILTTTLDQATLFGKYEVTLDYDHLTTLMVFTSDTGIPSAGNPLTHPNPVKVVVSLPSSIRDLAGNTLENSGMLSFTPELVVLDAVVLPDSNGENFTDQTNMDTEHSGANWGNGRLTRGTLGGSGRLGSLRIKTNETVTLDTNSQTFPLPGTARDLLDNVNYDPDPSTWPDLTITDGIFEFSSIIIDPGGVLICKGTNPARVFSRGPIHISGVVDVSGASPPPHRSTMPFGQSGGLGGPGAGDGGDGGDRPDNTGRDDLLKLADDKELGEFHAIENPLADSTAGFPGGGIGRTNQLAAGFGGVQHPTEFPVSTSTVAPDVGTILFNRIPATSNCNAQQPGAPGGGASYATAGTPGTPTSPFLTSQNGASNLPDPTLAGDPADVNLEPPDPESGHNIRKLAGANLRGGAGGGGGGTNLFNSRTDSFSGQCVGASVTLDAYTDHSASGGGGGGGALQLVSGSLVDLVGRILARGGDGGSPLSSTAELEQRQTRGAPGGGGSGGAVRVQGLGVVIDGNNPGRIDVSGGAGGVSSVLGSGGDGGVGLIRLEDLSGSLTRAGEAPKLSPFDANTDPESRDWLSVGNLTTPRRRSETFTGAVSCWMQPEGDFFQLIFFPDDPGNVDPTKRYGWNMDVLFEVQDGEPPELLKYRGPDVNSPVQPDFETVLGNMLNHGLPGATGSYLCVRFQGAQSAGDISEDRCDLILAGAESQIAPGSLTPWVKHPAELNDYTPKPNMIRFSIVFDSATIITGNTASKIVGVTNLAIRAQPE